jgi:hypothetical protein
MGRSQSYGPASTACFFIVLSVVLDLPLERASNTRGRYKAPAQGHSRRTCSLEFVRIPHTVLYNIVVRKWAHSATERHAIGLFRQLQLNVSCLDQVAQHLFNWRSVLIASSE